MKLTPKADGWNVTDLTMTRGGSLTASYQLGGCVYALSGSVVSFERVHFVDCQLDGIALPKYMGGALATTGVGTSVEMVDVEMRGCRAGGVANGEGGALSIGQDTTLTAGGIKITNSSSGGTGGGLWSNAATVNIVGAGAVVANCSAALNGGGLRIQWTSTWAVSAPLTVSGNIAGALGGGISLSGLACAGSLAGAIVTGNTAGECGGGIHWTVKAPMTLVNGVVSGNRAANGSGICFHDFRPSTGVRIIDSVVSGNEASGYGGGVYFGMGVGSPDGAPGTVDTAGTRSCGNFGALAHGVDVWCGGASRMINPIVGGCTPGAMRLKRTRATPEVPDFVASGTYSLDMPVYQSPDEAYPAQTVLIPCTVVDARTLEFVSVESNHTGYHELKLAVGGSASRVRLTSLITYVEHQCFDEGTVWYGQRCQDCSKFKGAFCPGGTRFWPRAGYWSADEAQPPTQCRLKAACPGAMGDNNVYPARVDEGGRRLTTQCSSGYADAFCSTCKVGYYQEYGVCRACGSSASVETEMALMLVVAGGYFVVVLVGLFWLSPRSLVGVVAVVLAVQQMVIVAKVALQQVAESTKSEVVPTIVRVLSILNFEIQVVKPGCAISAMSFVSLYFGTLLVVCAAGIGFLVVVWLRTRVCGSGSQLQLARQAPVSQSVLDLVEAERRGAGRHGPRAERNSISIVSERLTAIDTASTRSDSTVSSGSLVSALYVRSRLKHSLVILGALAYLQIALRSVQALHCVRAGDGELRLKVELRVVCYSGAHMQAAVVAWGVMAGYCVGFPVWIGVTGVQTLRKVKGLHAAVIDLALQSYGLLLRGLKPTYFWFRAVQVAATLSFIAETVTIAEDGMRMFACAMNFVGVTAIVVVLNPFVGWLHTWLAVGTGVAGTGQLLYFLFAENSGLFAVGAIVSGAVFAVLAGIGLWRRRRERGKGERMIAPARGGDGTESPLVLASLPSQLGVVDEESPATSDTDDVEVLDASLASSSSSSSLGSTVNLVITSANVSRADNVAVGLGTTSESQSRSGDHGMGSKTMSLTLAGAGAGSTVIDCGFPDMPIMTFAPMADGWNVTDLTLRRGGSLAATYSSGGCVHAMSASVVTFERVHFEDCVLDGGLASYQGGAMMTNGAGGVVTLNDVVVRNTRAGGSAPGEGGGIAVGQDTTLVANGLRVEGCSASDAGGGIWANAATVNVIGAGLTLVGNTAAKVGGGMVIKWTTTVSVTAALNVTSNSAVRAVDSVVSDNVATGYGGGVYFGGSGIATIERVAVVDNTAMMQGSGVFVGRDMSPSILACNISRNLAPTGAGFAIADGAPGTVDTAGTRSCGNFGALAHGVDVWCGGASRMINPIVGGCTPGAYCRRSDGACPLSGSTCMSACPGGWDGPRCTVKTNCASDPGEGVCTSCAPGFDVVTSLDARYGTCVVAASPPPSPSFPAPPPFPSPPPPMRAKEPQPVVWTLSPSVSPYAGGIRMRLKRTRATPEVPDFVVSGTYSLDMPVYQSPDEAYPAQTVSIPCTVVDARTLEFVSVESNHTGYHELKLAVGGSASRVRLTSLITYVEHQCFDEGTVWYGQRCQDCSKFKGAFCPGGTRFWPRAGYWSADEAQPPTQCRLKAACPGAMGDNNVYPARVDEGGRRLTTQCSSGYADAFCSTCKFRVVKPGCAISAMSFVSLYFGTLLVVCAAGIGFLVVVWLRTRVCGSGSQLQLARQAPVSQSVLDLVEAERRGAGRHGPRAERNSISIVSERLTAIDTASTRSDSTVSGGSLVSALYVRSRLKHSLVILGALAYLQIALRSVQALHCVRAGDGELRLKVELRVVCYSGAHMQAAVVAWGVMAGYCVGFPVWIGVTGVQTLRKVKGLHAAVIDLALQSYGLLLRGLKPTYFWFRAVQVAATLSFIAETVTIAEDGMRMFACAMNFVGVTAIVVVLNPFVGWLHTWLAVGTGVAGTGQLLYFLFAENSGLFAVGAIVSGAVFAVLAGIGLWRRRRERGKGERMIAPARGGDGTESPLVLASLPSQLGVVDEESPATSDTDDVEVLDASLASSSSSLGSTVNLVITSANVSRADNVAVGLGTTSESQSRSGDHGMGSKTMSFERLPARRRTATGRSRLRTTTPRLRRK
ncbi:uncharacterized protein AMSG_12226 [Thecamonas trahens ATCC 50062]|uniref:Right handed beta helix domain-containing protein n=1 Tax=Thecamonas trahens ATCC 50062 TaxID=461836 RepID=A0A0L0DKV6_THETB|nr:hypothetical protein AMSG_12226 [Thecamonas trahens ATCC 50062]KNC52865.1 hypothetical protein AMSG_12226 [Thecamonas trahens ATCC 50062]|eukprot:XP_013755012.1 hypothetical protein AMSG_12226 [Thecamonas trahens ATCC 50062]